MHVVSRVATTIDAVPPPSIGILNNRPARIAVVNVQYIARNVPTSFNFLVQAANGEEIYRSPLLLAGSIPSKFRAVMPSNTDFGLYPLAQPVITINTSTDGVEVAMNIKVLYKYPSATIFN